MIGDLATRVLAFMSAIVFCVVVASRVGIFAAGYVEWAEGTAPSAGASGVTRMYADSTAHTLKVSVNGGATFNDMLTSATGCALSGCTLTGALNVTASGSTFGSTATNVLTSNVNAGVATGAWIFKTPNLGGDSGIGYSFEINGAAKLQLFQGGDMRGITVTTGALTGAWRVPSQLATTLGSKPTCVNAGTAGQLIYSDDTDDAASGQLCVCRADSGGTYAWVEVQDNATACP